MTGDGHERRDARIDATAASVALPLLRSAVIPAPFRHGFTTRAGGVSARAVRLAEPGRRSGATRAATWPENRRRLRARRRVARPSTSRRRCTARRWRACAPGTIPSADRARSRPTRSAATAPGVALGVFVADCIPVLIADPRTGAVAAVHAGWRGTVAGVVPAAVRALARPSSARAPDDLRVAMGPAIGPCCFEVGAEVVAAFARRCSGAAAGCRRVHPSPRGVPRQVARRSEGGEPRCCWSAPASRRSHRRGPECTRCDGRASSPTAATGARPGS